MTNRQGGVIETTDEGINWCPPFALPVKRPFWGPTPAGEKWLAEHPEEAKKAEGYVPTTLIPFSADTIKQKKINDGYEPPKDEPMQTVTNDAPARHISDAPIPGPKPQGRYQQRTRRCISFNRTTDAGTAVWKMMSPKDAQTSDVFKFYDADPLWNEATKHLTYQRNEYVDFRADVTFHSDGYCIADQIVEVQDMANELTTPLKNAAERKKAKDAADAKDSQPKTSEWEDHDPARFKLFFGWYNGECELRQLTDETAKNEIRRRAAQIAAGVDSFKDLPDNVTWEQLKAIVFEILKVEYTRKPTKEAWLDWLRSRGYSADYILPILSEYQQKAGGKPVDRFSDYNGELSDAERDIAAFQAERRDPPSKPQNGHSQDAEHRSSDVSETTQKAPSKPQETAIDNSPEIPNSKVVGEIKAAGEFTPSPLLAEIKTLMGIPAGRLGEVLNRPHQKDDYKRIQAKDGSDFWTDLDPYAVRQRFDKVFGAQGIGWRLVPVAGVGKVEHRAEKRTSKGGREYTAHIVSYVAFQFEYALVIGGQIQYVQTSALSDSCENEDEGYAYRSAFTSLTKQALKTFGGFDHFADKAA